MYIYKLYTIHYKNKYYKKVESLAGYTF